MSLCRAALVAATLSVALPATAQATPTTTNLKLTPQVHAIKASWELTGVGTGQTLTAWRVKWRPVTVPVSAWTTLKPDLPPAAREYTIPGLEVRSYEVQIIPRYEEGGLTKSGKAAIGVATPLAEEPPAGFVTACAPNLCLNGSTYRFDGGNITPACSPPTNIEAALTNFSGIEAIRVWLFQKFATSGGARTWTNFDKTLEIAAAHNVKVVVTLENQWKDCIKGGYKTRAWYEAGYKTTVQSEELVTYREWVNEIVTRYKANTAILAWQLINEAEDKQSESGSCEETSARSALRAFIDDVGGLIHSLDPNHLVDLGVIGEGQCGAQGADYKTVHESAGTDLCDYHDYNHETEAIPTGTNRLSQRLEQCEALKKPIMVDETGMKTSSSRSETQRYELFRAKWKAQLEEAHAKCAACENVVGEQLWSLNPAHSVFENFDIGPSDPSAALLTEF